MNSNPEKSVQAIVNPAPLTLAQLALFEKIDAPVLYADVTSLRDNLIALWIYKNPIREVAKNFEKREELALAWSEKLTGEDYGDALTELLQACTAFYEMMPRKESSGEIDEAEDGEAADGEAGVDEQPKKALSGSATDGSPSLRSGCAGHTIMKLAGCWKRLRLFVSRCFTAVGRRRSAS